MRKKLSIFLQKQKKLIIKNLETFKTIKMFSCFCKKTKISPSEYVDGPIDNEIVERMKQTNKVIFGNEFNYPVINLPNSITTIRFSGGSFNHSLDNLPVGIKELTLNSRFNQPLDYLPYGLEVLKFQSGSIFSHSLDNLPLTIKILEIPLLYNHEINCLPNSVEQLRIGVKVMLNDDNILFPESSHFDNEENIQYFDKQIRKIPEKLKNLYIFPDYNYLNDLQEKYGNKVVVISKEMRNY